MKEGGSRSPLLHGPSLPRLIPIPLLSIASPEIFGPVCCIARFTTEAEVLKKANDTPYGLAAAVFTENIRTAHRMVRKLNAGMVFVNSSGDASLQLPFGGNKVTSGSRGASFLSKRLKLTVLASVSAVLRVRTRAGKLCAKLLYSAQGVSLSLTSLLPLSPYSRSSPSFNQSVHWNLNQRV